MWILRYVNPLEFSVENLADTFVIAGFFTGADRGLGGRAVEVVFCLISALVWKRMRA